MTTDSAGARDFVTSVKTGRQLSYLVQQVLVMSQNGTVVVPTSALNDAFPTLTMSSNDSAALIDAILNGEFELPQYSD
jgi:hypothetical protein